jgi:hypothetical protein
MPAQASPEVIALLREDLLPTAIGLLICGLGLAAGTLALLRRRIEPTLASFAGLALLYGVRLLADTATASLLFPGSGDSLERGINVITYLIPIPAFLFFRKLVGQGWRSLLRRLWQLQLALAVIAVPLELVSTPPGILLGLYRVLVLAGMAAITSSGPGGCASATAWPCASSSSSSPSSSPSRTWATWGSSPIPTSSPWAS